MAKFNFYNISKKEKDELLNELYFIINQLNTKEQIVNFFKDILTKSEEVMLARRIRIARMLLEGESCIQISRKLKTGLDTITKVQKWLKDGLGDYVKLLNKISKKTQQKNKDIDPNSLQGLANRFPLYFGLTNAVVKTLRGKG
jgi:TrpR-related protein YerC/YecD